MAEQPLTHTLRFPRAFNLLGFVRSLPVFLFFFLSLHALVTIFRG